MSEQPSNPSLTNRLLAALLTREMQLSDGAPLLAQLGLGNADIGAVYGTTEATVRSAVSRGRRREKAEGNG